MKDPNSPEAVAARANQEDPIVVYLIVRESLGMSAGKLAAQCAHASQMLLLKYLEEVKKFDARKQAAYDADICYSIYVSPQDNDRMNKEWNLFQNWLQTSFRKIVLRADDKEWLKIKAEIPESNRIIVVDAGLTEVSAGSETVIGIWPMLRSERPKLIKKLQVLK